MDMDPGAVLATALGYAIVCGSVILKLPQALKIIKAGSAEGVSLQSALMETLVYTIGASWGVARGWEYKEYGENVSVLVQLAILVLVIGFYQGKLATAFLPLVAVLALGYTFISAPEELREYHEMFQKSSVFIGIASRLPQIYSNYRARSTGQLAFLTVFLAFGGSGARVFTTAKNIPWESGKATVLLQFGIAFSLNAVVLLQMWAYRGSVASTAGKKTVAKKTTQEVDNSRASSGRRRAKKEE